MANVESMEISHRVYKIANECEVSGNYSNNLLEFHNLVGANGVSRWESFSGKKVLDVCAGLSDFTARLLELGADAYAIDYGYQDVEELLIRSGHPGVSRFLESFENDRERYVSGSAHNLPFSPESFDAVTSYYGIFGVIDDDLDLAFQAINEAVRVLKPGGILSVGPFQSGEITKRQGEAEEEILEKLDKRKDLKIFIKSPDRKIFFGPRPDISRLGKLSIIKVS